MQTETKLTSRLVKAWRESGAEVLNIHGGGFYQSVGWPDCFVCSKLWQGWIEFKGPVTKLQSNQARLIQALSKTENVWIVRFDDQEGQGWWFSVIDSYSQVVLTLNAVGTDGQAAMSLLRELAKLDGN